MESTTGERNSSTAVTIAPERGMAYEIHLELENMKTLLTRKNKSYGDSISNPVNVFSKLESVEAIRVRIDDKLARIKNGAKYPGDDDITDLIGYLVRLKIANKLENGSI